MDCCRLGTAVDSALNMFNVVWNKTCVYHGGLIHTYTQHYDSSADRNNHIYSTLSWKISLISSTIFKKTRVRVLWIAPCLQNRDFTSPKLPESLQKWSRVQINMQVWKQPKSCKSVHYKVIHMEEEKKTITESRVNCLMVSEDGENSSTYYMAHTHIGPRDTCTSRDKGLERHLSQWSRHIASGCYIWEAEQTDRALIFIRFCKMRIWTV